MTTNNPPSIVGAALAPALGGDGETIIIPRIAPAGAPSRAKQGEEILPRDVDERLATARRLVAERCLYGVDKNPMAVEMAKLSLWLITLAKNKPFTFLDSNLRYGDSLLGVNLRQLQAFSMDQGKDQEKVEKFTLIGEPMREALNFALPRRRAISMRLEQTVGDVEEKERKLREADEAMQVLKLGADLLVAQALHKKDQASYKAIWDHLYAPYVLLLQSYHAAQAERFTQAGRQPARAAFQRLRAKVDALLVDEDNKLSGVELNQFLSDKAGPELQQKIAALPKTRTPFHWPLEFPEVFAGEGDEAGFAGIVSNPPFMGGNKITGELGEDYRECLVEYLANGKRGSADLCAYFFLRAAKLIQHAGMSALLATNTIAQGDTREVGLDQITAEGWTIPRAIPSRKWPGEANLEIAHVWMRNGTWQDSYMLDDKPVENITTLLTAPGKAAGNPYKLTINANKSFIGSYVLGLGFVLEPQEVQSLITRNPRNKDVLFPYLNGEDLTSRFDQSPSRWVINFHDWPLEQAEEYIECIKIVREKVKPERDRNNRKVRRERWWQFAERAAGLYIATVGMGRALIIPRISKYMLCSWKSTGVVSSEMTITIATESNAHFAVIQCTLHDNWTRQRGSTLETRLLYTPSDCFETFPFPTNTDGLESIGERYSTHRQSIMLARREGLTKTYNRFHNPNEHAPDIVRLRELHREMDEAVARAYGWEDLRLEHGFHETKQGLRYTISEAARREVLDRLLLLNHQRHAEEVTAGLVDESGRPLKGKAKGTKGAQNKKTTGASVANYWTSSTSGGNDLARPDSSPAAGDEALEDDGGQRMLF